MEYWIIINGAARGPYQLHELTTRGCTASTPVWREGLQAWSPAATLPELQPLFAEPTVIDVHAQEATFPETDEELLQHVLDQSEEAYQRKQHADDLDERLRRAVPPRKPPLHPSPVRNPRNRHMGSHITVSHVTSQIVILSRRIRRNALPPISGGTSRPRCCAASSRASSASSPRDR
ncbi:MAG: DUF4339 domain-containing protein [Bacteroidales bacterium]|nr:DUF4339 domain-containing protein [Bacteroidales bacterium]